MMHTRCDHDLLDPSPASGGGLEVESGKNDTTRVTIAALTETSWIFSKSLGIINWHGLGSVGCIIEINCYGLRSADCTIVISINGL